MTTKKKPNKQQREKQRAHDADIFNNGFKMGFEMGYKQRQQELQEQANREKVKVMYRGL